MRERDIERALVRAVEAAGGMCLKFVSPGRRHVPDRLCLFPGGRSLFVEVKAPGKRPRPGQERAITALRALGYDVAVVDGMAEIEVALAEFG
jgi:phosphoserine phosphatase